MNMNTPFEFAAGSVIGRSHRITGKNNQDAYCIMADQDCTVAVVCDGCSSGQHNEVGAGLGARLLAHTLLCQASQQNWWPTIDTKNLDASIPLIHCYLEQVRQEVLAQLLILSKAMGERPPSIVGNYFLFTIVSVIITHTITIFFSLGDGVLIINEQEYVLGPFPNNAPPYLAYELLAAASVAVNPDTLRFQLNRILPTDEVQSLLIGTDGVHDLAQATDRALPGKGENVGPINQFWQEDFYFANPDAVRRRLAGVNRESTTLDRMHGGIHREQGLLPDDTTLIVARRRVNSEDNVAQDAGNDSMETEVKHEN